MPARHTPETLLISAVLNSEDPFYAKQFGITTEHFKGFREEYSWLLDYADQYGELPSVTQMHTKFPTFPYEKKQKDGKWPAQEVKRVWASRDLLKRAQLALSHLSANKVEEAFAEIEGARLEIVTSKPEDALVDPAFLDDYDDVAMRIQVPWPTLQRLTNGIGPGEMWFLAARQGNGKSSYLIDMAVEAAFSGHRVLFYSMEMTKRQVQVRAQAAMAHRLGIKVNEHQMLHKTYDRKQYKQLLKQINAKMEETGGALHIHVPSMGRVSPGVIASFAGEYELHVIDYIGLMYTDEGNPVMRDWRDIAMASASLKQIALAKETRVLAASQVNREGDGSGPKPPKLRHLAQSDYLGNDGDVVLTMKRYGTGAGIFSVEKNRHGPSLNLFYTIYDPNEGNFGEINSDKANDIKDESEGRDY